MPYSLSRRRFLASAATTTATAAAAVVTAPGVALAQEIAKPTTATAGKLRIGIVGIGGQGFWHVEQIQPLTNAEIVAICETDTKAMVRAARKLASAEPFVDFREMLKKPDLDAVLVATPDHTHAAISADALRAGKHVYCEKPLTHTVREARAVAELAKQTRLVTQLGIQIHSKDNYRRVVELIKAGAIGKVSEVHVWHDRRNRPASRQRAPVPATLNYDLWLGPVPHRPFVADYHPYNWRRYWAFGSGMLGDIGCHLMDVAFWALDLAHPTRVEAVEGAPHDDEVAAEWIIAAYEFPARGDRPPVKLTWYDAPKRPPMLAGWNLPENLAGEGVVFVGEDGRLLFTNYGRHLLLPADRFKDYPRPPQSIPSSPGHQAEWINACLAHDPAATSTPFTYGALLTEAALLGTVAFRAGKPLEWDAAAMKIKNAPEAEALLDQPRREGWTA